jgi:hypothetical protein
MDKGYDDATDRRYIAQIRQRGEGSPPPKRHPARHEMVEYTHSWHNRFRNLLVR